MRIRIVLAQLALVSSLAACVPCLQPISTNRNLVDEPALVGVWATPESNETWTFSAGRDKSYRVVHLDSARSRADDPSGSEKEPS
jgi:hypothetical protein